MNASKLVPFICTILISLGNAADFKVTSQVYMDFAHDDKPIGRVIIGLFGEVAPRTVANFRTICTEGIGNRSYAGSSIHRVIDKFMIQGGDIVSGDGKGSISIYGTYFADEHLDINHTAPGFLAMANKGPNTNGCQFYITTMATPWLDGKHTIFGKVIRGQGYVHSVEKVKTDTDDFPVKPVFITDCGEEPTNAPFTVSDNLYDLMGWINSSAVPLGISFAILACFHVMIRKLDRVINEKEKGD